MDAVKKSLDIRDDEVRKAYDGDKDAQTIPERRQVQQIPFKDRAAAEAAAKAAAQGKSFLDIAKEQGASETDIDLGTVTKAELLDQKIAEAAFALAKDQVSAPVDGRFRTVLLRVTKIEPGRQRTFDDMKDDIRDKLATGRANDALRRLHETGRRWALGRQAAEGHRGCRQAHLYRDRRDRSAGRKADGKPAYEGSQRAEILRAGFAAKQGVESEPIDLEDGGYAWVDALAVTAERQRPFDEVKDDVKTVWRELEVARQLSELAAKLIERAGKGEKLSALAVEAGGKLATSPALKRFAADPAVPPSAAQRAFGLQRGALASTETPDGKSRLVFRLVDIKKPDPAPKELADRMTTQLRGEVQQDLLQAYVGALRERFGATVNEAVYTRLVGTGDQR